MMSNSNADLIQERLAFSKRVRGGIVGNHHEGEKRIHSDAKVTEELFFDDRSEGSFDLLDSIQFMRVDESAQE